ncbi:endonuclease [Haliangium sp.]|uniref:endonuclease n=1 Tax=Haliangium sp. TaxID=2663208 RepID=UPI003D0BA498
MSTCAGACGLQSTGGCWCDEVCADFGNCCPDYEQECGAAVADDSCRDRCDTQAPAGCWCNPQCVDLGDCCLDYASACQASPGDDPWPGLADTALIDALEQATTSGHIGLGYGRAREHMYGVSQPSIDVHDGVIEGIYTGVTQAPDGSTFPGGVINTEHSWPRSDGAEGEPMESDLHHLFPTKEEANTQRANYDFGETVCADAACPWNEGGSERGPDSDGDTVFQVRPDYRGDIARAHFYFSVRYRLPIPGVGTGQEAVEEQVLRAWHAQDPPSPRERRRNDVIEAVQGNRNPFVDYPGLVDRISDF